MGQGMGGHVGKCRDRGDRVEGRKGTLGDRTGGQGTHKDRVGSREGTRGQDGGREGTRGDWV